MKDHRPSLGQCCACLTRRGVRNVLCLQSKHPQPGKGLGWGCFVCGLPAEGAIAVVCDRCLKRAPANLTFACGGRAAEPERVPIAKLTGTHQHDKTKHPEKNQIK